MLKRISGEEKADLIKFLFQSHTPDETIEYADNLCEEYYLRGRDDGVDDRESDFRVDLRALLDKY
jgi:hypothetical protein